MTDDTMPVAEEVEAMANFLNGHDRIRRFGAAAAMLRRLSRQIAAKDAALQRIATGTFNGPYANRPAEIAQFAADALKWTAGYSYDKTDDHTRLFCAASDLMDRAERAEAERDSQQRVCMTVMAERDAALRSLEAITEQIAAVREDAERYRWLRTVRRCHPVFVIRADDARGDTMLFYDQLDAAIDAARREPPA